MNVFVNQRFTATATESEIAAELPLFIFGKTTDNFGANSIIYFLMRRFEMRPMGFDCLTVIDKPIKGSPIFVFVNTIPYIKFVLIFIFNFK